MALTERSCVPLGTGHESAGCWTDAKVKLPEAVRPWVRPAVDCAADVPPSARLVSHEFSTPLHEVDGLHAVVNGLPGAKQAAALAWCKAEGLYESDAIIAVGATDDFIRSLQLDRADANKVRQRLGGLDAATRR